MDEQQLQAARNMLAALKRLDAALPDERDVELIGASADASIAIALAEAAGIKGDE